jgi:hypothetical protein
MSNDLIDPAELMRRGFHLWSSTRWPGRDGRLRYAHTLFNLYVVRQLALLAMRVWDGDSSRASERLAQVQGVLHELWTNSPGDQPVLVRDARSLIPLALSPATEKLAPYFEVAERIATGLAPDDRVETLKAVVRMAGGHLRSYLHYYVTQKGATLDELSFVVRTRKSEALDFSLLIHGLVPLIEAYERAVQSGDGEQRLELADAVCQGISPDPELFVNRVDLLGAYSMVEYLLTTDRDGHAVYTQLGRRHVELLEEYAARLARVASSLYEDCRHFRPQRGAYSPYGALYGVASNLLEHMALKILDRGADARFGLEDVFTAGTGEKLAWVSGWRKLPHVSREVARLYAYPQEFAERIFARVEQALQMCVEGASRAARAGRLFVVPGEAAEAEQNPASIAALPLRFIGSSDREIVAAQKAHAEDRAQLARDRQEGHFLLSYPTSGGWVAITKDVLTEVLGTGCDARIAGLPAIEVERLRLLGRDLIALAPANR